MRSRNTSEGEFNVGVEPKPSLRERTADIYRNHKTAAGLGAGAVALIAVESLVVGVSVSSEPIAEHMRMTEAEKSHTTTTKSGNQEIEKLTLGLDSYCEAAIEAWSEDTSARTEWKQLGIAKYMQMDVDALVTLEFCQPATAGSVEIIPPEDGEPGKYHIYVPEDDLYVKTFIDFGSTDTEDPDESRVSVRPKKSGSATTIPEGVLDAVAERLDTSDDDDEPSTVERYASALSLVQDTKEAVLLDVALAQAEDDVASECGPEVFPAIEQSYKEGIIRVAKKWATTGDKNLEDYDFEVFIGDQSPDNPDNTIRPPVLTEDNLARMAINEGVISKSGDTQVCKLAEDAIVEDLGEAR